MINELFESLLTNARIEIKNGKFNQTQRNNLKNQLVSNVMNAIEVNDNVRIGLTDKGIIIEVQNESVGSICFGVDMSIKAYDYDFDTETELYKQYKQGVADRKAEKTKQKELKIVNDKKARAKKLQEQIKKLDK